jgi:hypothetical protein
MLKFDDKWRFDSPDVIPQQVDQEFFKIINKLAKGEQTVLEHFKNSFGAASGNVPSISSSASWASSDLSSYMSEATSNAPVFIEAFYDGWTSLGSGYPAVNIDLMNRILSQNGTRYQIYGDKLLYDGPEVIPSPQLPKSLLEEAKRTIEAALNEGDKLISERRYRPAVQEILWLLETIVTVFDGIEIDGQTIEGKYFNQIIDRLAKKTDGTTLKQVIDWVRKLHGYLSAPAGGGIRHGVHLADGVATTPNEAILYYNLAKSYITYFLGEYERIKDANEPANGLPPF